MIRALALLALTLLTTATFQNCAGHGTSGGSESSSSTVGAGGGVTATGDPTYSADPVLKAKFDGMLTEVRAAISTLQTVRGVNAVVDANRLALVQTLQGALTALEAAAAQLASVRSAAEAAVLASALETQTRNVARVVLAFSLDSLELTAVQRARLAGYQTELALAFPDILVKPAYAALNTWMSVTTTGAVQARYGSGLVAADDHLFLFGGQVAGGGDVSAPMIYTIATKKWSAASTSGAPTPRESPNMGYDGKGVLVWGGLLQVPGVGQSYPVSGGYYDFATDRWKAVPADNSPGGRFTASTLDYKGKTVVIGGANAGSCVYGGSIYDPANNTWKRLPVAAHSGKSAGAAIVGNKLYAFYFQGSSVYDFDTDKWTAIANPPNTAILAGCGQPAVAVGGKVVLPGVIYDPAKNAYATLPRANGADTSLFNPFSGYATSDDRALLLTSATAELYDPVTGKTTSLGNQVNAPALRGGIGIAWSGRELYYFGGYLSGTYFNDLKVYR